MDEAEPLCLGTAAEFPCATLFAGKLTFQRERLSWRPHWRVEYRGALENRGDVAVNYAQRPREADYVLAMRSYNEH